MFSGLIQKCCCSSVWSLVPDKVVGEFRVETRHNIAVADQWYPVVVVATVEAVATADGVV